MQYYQNSQYQNVHGSQNINDNESNSDYYMNETDSNIDTQSNKYIVKGILGNLNPDDQNIFESFQKLNNNQLHNPLQKVSNFQQYGQQNQQVNQENNQDENQHYRNFDYNQVSSGMEFKQNSDQSLITGTKGVQSVKELLTRNKRLSIAEQLKQEAVIGIDSQPMFTTQKIPESNKESSVVVTAGISFLENPSSQISNQQIHVKKERVGSATYIRKAQRAALEQTFRNPSMLEENKFEVSQEQQQQDGNQNSIQQQQNYEKLQSELNDIKKTLEKLETSNKYITQVKRNIASAKTTHGMRIHNPINFKAETDSQNTQEIVQNQILNQYQKLDILDLDSEYISKFSTQSRSVGRAQSALRQRASQKSQTANIASSENQTQLLKNLKSIMSKKGGVPYLQNLINHNMQSANSYKSVRSKSTNKSRSKSPLNGRFAFDTSSRGLNQTSNNIYTNHIEVDNPFTANMANDFKQKGKFKLKQSKNIAIIQNQFNSTPKEKFIDASEVMGTLTTPDNSQQYKGNLKNGKRHGYGEQMFILDSIQCKRALIKGSWKNGFLSGKAQILIITQHQVAHKNEHNINGTIIGSDNSANISQQITPKNQNLASSTVSNNNQVSFFCKTIQESFEGIFKKGQACGFGVLKFSNGDQFQGFFNKSLKNGNVSFNIFLKVNMQFQGKYVCVSDATNQFRFQGDFIYNYIEGNGTLQYLNGHTYQGNIIKNILSGLGQLKLKNGILYEGNFQNNQFEGRGQIVVPMISMIKNYRQTISPIAQSPINSALNTLASTHTNVFSTNYNHNMQQNSLFKYQGEFKSGKFHGKGSCSWNINQDNKPSTVTFEGHFQNSQIDGGKGTFYFGQNIIHGFFKESKLTGQAFKQQVINDKLSIVYKGNFTSDENYEMEGFGELIWTTQNYNNQYIGEFNQNKIQGQGQFSFMDQYGGLAQYYGGMRNNQFYGKGELQFSNGDKYSGQFQNGIFEGSGQFSFNNNQFVYSGLFLNGQFHGQSQLKCQSSFVLKGNFINGAIDCSSNVQISYTNGDQYVGKINVQYQLNGSGVYRCFMENFKLTGTFKDGLPHSYCKKTYHQIGNSQNILKTVYGYYNQGKLNGNAIEQIHDSETGQIISRNNQIYINNSLQKFQTKIGDTIDNSSLTNESYYESIEKQCQYTILN
eukprot:403358269